MSGSAVAMPMGRVLALPRWLLPAAAAAALLVAALAAAHALKPQLNQPLQALRVDGTLTHLQPQQIAAAAAIEPGARLFDVDIGAVRSRVEALPWVAHARVTRLWPARLAIRVWERKPAALWGEHALVDEEGVAFTPPPRDVPQGLPKLDGPAGREAVVVRDYQQLAAALAGTPYTPNGLRLDARGSWTMTTTSGIELRLGEDDPRDRSAAILGVVGHSLADKLDQVAYIDLRYRNGFAVGWVSRDDCQRQSVPANARPGMAGPGCQKKAEVSPGTAATTAECLDGHSSTANARPRLAGGAGVEPGKAGQGCTKQAEASPGAATTNPPNAAVPQLAAGIKAVEDRKP